MQKCQKDVEEWTAQFKIQYWSPHEIMARLMEESGELAREVNHRWGPKKKKATEDKAELADEMSDIIFTIVCMANSQNISLDDAWKKMMNKLMKRDNNRFEKK